MTLSTSYVLTLVEGVEQKGVPREQFLKAAGFDLRRLDVVDDRVTREEYDALAERALDVYGPLGLYMGEIVSPAPYSVTAHLIAQAPTLRSAVEGLRRFHRLLNDRPVYDLVEQDGIAALCFDVGPGSRRCRQLHADFNLLCLYRMVRLFARGTKPARVDFEHGAPPYAAEYGRVFEGALRFGQPANRIVFDRELLDVPQPHQDSEMYSVLEAQAQRRVTRLARETSYSDRVFEYLLECAPPDQRDMRAAAREVGLSVRSLRRRLSEEGAAFDEIAEKALAARAKRFLCDQGLSLDETAYMLGFSERSAFCRAFKRWTGTTAARYRSQQR
jgi:AraC-like DNA-binding protein